MSASRGCFSGHNPGRLMDGGDAERSHRQRFSRWCLRLGAGLVLCFGSWAGVADSGNEARPKIHDGMNAAEERRAIVALERELAAPSMPDDIARVNVAERSVAAPAAAPTLLLMERRHDKGAVERLADAWYYDYAHNETIHKIVNLDSGEMVSSEVVIGTQLPLIESEIDNAFQIVLASPEDRRALAEAFRQVTGNTFQGRAQVSYKAFVFHPDTVADGLSAEARRCGAHRCAQMLIYTHDNIALDMSPVVDLSTARVLENLELRAQAIVRREDAAL